VGYGGSIANWSIVALGSVFAPTDQAMMAVQLLTHSGQSLVLNPQWSQMQRGFENMVARSNMAQAVATIRQTAQMNAYQQRVIQNMGHEQDNFNDIINGVSLTRDPTTGQEYEVPLGTGGPQWIDPGRSAVVQSALSPGPGFNQLQTISR
jgi:tryptophanase